MYERRGWSAMRVLKTLYFLIGIALLVAVLAHIDSAEVMARVGDVGWGLAVVLGLYLAAFSIDSLTWHLTLTSISMSAKGLYRTWKVRLVGESFNAVMPAAGMGGELVKATLLKTHYGVGYGEAVASIVLARTINLIALVLFLVIGFAFILGAPELPVFYKVMAGAGLVALSFGTFVAFALQRLQVASLAGSWLSQWRFAKGAERVLHHIFEMDARLVGFYTAHRRRFAWAAFWAFLNWVLGAIEIYYALYFLGHPVSVVDAWIIEAVAQLVRTGTFFIPASIGAQEASFLLVCGAMTGSPALGVAVAVVRRIREIVWIVWGMGVGLMYSLKPAAEHVTAEENYPGAER